MNNSNLYVPPQNKVPSWVGWLLGVGFGGIILGSGVIVWKQLGPTALSASVAAAPAVSAPTAPAATPTAVAAPAPEAAPAVAAPTPAEPSPERAPVAKGKAKSKAKPSKLAKASKGSKGYSEQRSKQILAKHDSSSSRSSKQKLDRLLGL